MCDRGRTYLSGEKTRTDLSKGSGSLGKICKHDYFRFPCFFLQKEELVVSKCYWLLYSVVNVHKAKIGQNL